MSIVLLIGGKTVGKLDEVGNWEVTVVEAAVIAEVATAVSTVGKIGGSSRYLSLSVPHSSPSSHWQQEALYGLDEKPLSQPTMGSAISQNNCNLIVIFKAL